MAKVRKAKLKKRGGGEPKTNSALTAKVELRQSVLERLGVDSPRVLDCFCAGGEMWRAAYGGTDNYLGLDKNQFDDERRTVVCDNTRFLRHYSLDLDQFDVFDLDAFGSPAYPLAIICQRLRWSRVDKVAVFLTDDNKRGALPSGLLNYLGLERGGGGAQYDVDDVLSMLISASCAAAGAEPLGVIRAMNKSKGAGMRYIGYVMQQRR